jgi:hypothetical protein
VNQQLLEKNTELKNKIESFENQIQQFQLQISYLTRENDYFKSRNQIDPKEISKQKNLVHETDFNKSEKSQFSKKLHNLINQDIEPQSHPQNEKFKRFESEIQMLKQQNENLSKDLMMKEKENLELLR